MVHHSTVWKIPLACHTCTDLHNNVYSVHFTIQIDHDQLIPEQFSFIYFCHLSSSFVYIPLHPSISMALPLVYSINQQTHHTRFCIIQRVIYLYIISKGIRYRCAEAPPLLGIHLALLGCLQRLYRPIKIFRNSMKSVYFGRGF